MVVYYSSPLAVRATITLLTSGLHPWNAAPGVNLLVILVTLPLEVCVSTSESTSLLVILPLVVHVYTNTTILEVFLSGVR